MNKVKGEDFQISYFRFLNRRKKLKSVKLKWAGRPRFPLYIIKWKKPALSIEWMEGGFLWNLWRPYFLISHEGVSDIA